MAMIIKCPQCSKCYGEKDFTPGIDLYCSCGQKILFEPEQVFAQLAQICDEYQLKIEEEKIIQIRKKADKIVALIFNNQCAKIDIDIEKQKLKALIEHISPDKVDLYELIYEPRFNRLWDQFRKSEDT
ncbi:MAG: hypothetical protein KJ915_10220 [Candidatus Omnitrophica bacterium]|nr:hypothetical protein [Candidatus Omnitrophota bacterium]